MPGSPATHLRPFAAADVAFFAGLARDPRVTRYVGDGRPWDEDRIAARAGAALALTPTEQVGAARWFVAEEAGAPVALVTLTRTAAGVELGYWVVPEHWGRGVAGRVVEHGLAAAARHYGPGPLLARVDPDNPASGRALLRGGFRLEERRDGLDWYAHDGARTSS